jgi:flagellar motor switch protein FliN/FliY
MAERDAVQPDVVRSEGEEGIELLLDVPLRVSVELGRTRMLIQELLELGQGSVVDLERLAGEPVDILVNGRPIALGEIVVFNDRYAVRVVSINSPSERVESLA